MKALAIAALALLVPAWAASQSAPAGEPVDLPPEILSLACAPGLSYEPPPMPLRVTGSQHPTVHQTFAPGDLITVNAGTDNGVDVGQEYYTRRAMPIANRPIARDNPATIHTSGWIRIYAVDRRMSLATIVYACDSVELNDYLEPFALPSLPPAAGRLPAQRGNYGRVMIGNDNRTNFARGDYFVVDRGSDHGVTVGAQFVVYRDKQAAGNFLFELGDAVAVDVKPDSSTLRATVTRSGFMAGDYVALRK
ncbi:MAG: hypothetical protein A3F70_06065 [Acidobacteria bacterium RIFCSPLOWO2_12_FULL_67_14]|nr:MAG: hypothetical protein A3F70_06065 [Acidobacteria bacterium RIFCSPLOWO2_12_FULL_67_14]